MNKNLEHAAKISLSVLGILFVGSIFFYKERMLFVDAPFIIFNIIQSQSLQIQVERYGSFVTQVFPLLAFKAGLSLKWILLLYSMSFNFWYLFVALILYKFREYALVILLGFYLTLYVSDSYFWTNNEVHQGIAWMFLTFGILNFLYRKFEHRHIKFFVIALPIFAILSFISIYTHPLVMIVFSTIWGFYVFDKRKFYYSKQSIPFVVTILAICIFKILASQQNFYDSGLLSKVLDADLPEVLGTFTSGMADGFWKGGLTNYWLLWVIFIAGITALLMKKKIIQAAYLVLVCVSFFVLICLAFPHYNAKIKFYFESEWMALGILGSMAFVYYVLPDLKSKYVVGMVCFIFLIRIIYIGVSIPTFTHRIDYMNQLVSSMKKEQITKLVVQNRNYQLEENLLMTWALPYEIMYLTHLNKDTVSRTIIEMPPARIQELKPAGNQQDFIEPFGIRPISEINKVFFNLNTNEPYTVKTYIDIK